MSSAIIDHLPQRRPSQRAEDLLYYVIWERIASYSDELTLFTLGGVAKIFREIVDCDKMWQHRIFNGAALAQFSAEEMHEAFVKMKNTFAGYGQHNNNRYQRVAGMLPYMLLEPDKTDLSKNEVLEAKIDEIEDVIAELIHRSRTREGSWFVSDPAIAEDRKNLYSTYHLPNSFFLTNRSFVRYIAATFILQMGTGWSILLEKDLFLKSVWHPAVWWNFKRKGDDSDTLLSLVNGWYDDSATTSWRGTQTKDTARSLYRHILEDQQPAAVLSETLFIDISSPQPSYQIHRGAAVNRVFYLQEPGPAYQMYSNPFPRQNTATTKYTVTQVSPRLFERGQIVKEMYPNKTYRRNNNEAWTGKPPVDHPPHMRDKHDKRPLFYERPIQTLVSRCVAESARTRLRELILFWKVRDFVFSRVIWTSATLALSGVLFLGVKYLSSDYATLTQQQLDSAAQLLPNTSSIIMSAANNNSNSNSFMTTNTNTPASSTTTSYRYPFLRRESFEEANAGWFSFLSTAFVQKCASHVYAMFVHFPTPNIQKFQDTYPTIDRVLTIGAPIIYVGLELVTIFLYGVGNSTAQIGEYPKELLIPSFWKRMFLQIPVDFFAAIVGFICSRYSGIFASAFIALPISLLYRMSSRIFWFCFDEVSATAAAQSVGSVTSTFAGTVSSFISSGLSLLPFSSTMMNFLQTISFGYLASSSSSSSSSSIANLAATSSSAAVEVISTEASKIPFSSINWLSVAGSNFDPEYCLEWGFYLGHGIVQLCMVTRCFAFDVIGIENYARMVLMEMVVAMWHPTVDKRIQRNGWMKNLFNFDWNLKGKEKGGLRLLLEGALLQTGIYLLRYVVQELCVGFKRWKEARDEEKKKH